MLRSVTGTVLKTEESAVLLDVHGFGLYITVSKELAGTLAVGEDATLITHLAIKDKGVDLYGFPDEKTLKFFQLLLTVSGIGPKSAMGVVNLAHTGTLATAIQKQDISYLTSIAGIGKKMAEKIIVELKDKVEQTGESLYGEDTEVFDTLVALGYTADEARTAIQNIPSELTEKGDRLKHALKHGS